MAEDKKRKIKEYFLNFFKKTKAINNSKDSDVLSNTLNLSNNTEKLKDIDILYLWHLNHKFPDNTESWVTSYNIDYKESKKKFLAENYIRISTAFENISNYTVNELKNTLEKYNLKKNGTKAEIINRIAENVPESDL